MIYNIMLILKPLGPKEPARSPQHEGPEILLIIGVRVGGGGSLHSEFKKKKSNYMVAPDQILFLFIIF